MFDADRPIINSSQDRLNRAQFARYLARCMLDHQDPESLVIGLYGGWGVGKSSLINLVTEELNLAASNMLDTEKPIILNFSPWSYSGQSQLVYNFFRRLSSALRSAPYLENSERIIYLLELYVSFFTNKPVPIALKKQPWYKKLYSKKQSDTYAWESGRDLTQVKAELNQLLRNQKHKIIITIDNISRLYEDEIKQIFQIIKSMGDYVNTTYLLALDKEPVIHALDNIHGGGGEEYLEKIVQLSFDVPPISSQDLELIFADRVSTVLANVPADTWNSEYWADIYYNSIKYFFRHCRDVTHYTNILHFGYSRVRDVVNPADFFAITAIEVFEPTIYASIRDNKDLFSDLLDHVYAVTTDEREKDKIRCDFILSQANRLPRETILSLLIQLFPRLRQIYQPDTPFYHSDRLAGKLKRICSPEFFDLYFRLSMPTAHMHEHEFKTILSFAPDNEAFDQALMRLNQDGRVIQFLDHLNGTVIQSLSPVSASSIIYALLDNGDLFPPGVHGLLSLDTPMKIHRVIHALLSLIDDKDQRFQMMQGAIAHSSKSIYIITYVLYQQLHEHTEESDTFLPVEYRELMPDQLEALCSLTVTRIENWADTGRLVDYPKLLPVLLAWIDWGDEERCKKYVKQMTSTDRGLISFLSATLHEAIEEAMVSYTKQSHWQDYLADIDIFIPHRELEAHAVQLFEDGYFEKLREKEQLALMIFLDLINAKTTKLIPKTTA